MSGGRRRLVFLAVGCLVALGLSVLAAPRHRSTTAAGTGAATASSVPVLRLAIDDDYYPEKESVAQAAADFALLHRLGVKILRAGIGWDDTNPAPGVYTWSFWRAFIQRAAATGIEVRPYYLYPPAWAAAH